MAKGLYVQRFDWPKIATFLYVALSALAKLELLKQIAQTNANYNPPNLAQSKQSQP